MYKFINVLNKLKQLRIVHDIYYSIIKMAKKNSITGLNKNIIISDKALLLCSKIMFNGYGNLIKIAPEARVENYSFRIYGNNNKIVIGENCQMKDGEFWIEDDNNEIFIGANTTIQANTQFAAIEGCRIEIGEDCMFSSDIVVRTGDSHSIIDADNNRINKSANVQIGNHCWIGHRVMVMKGVVIPHNTLIGAGAIVNKQFDKENTIIAGVPSKVIKENVGWLRERV